MNFTEIVQAFFRLVSAVENIAESLSIMAGNVDDNDDTETTTTTTAADGTTTTTTDKPKRKRRTKKEIEAEKAAAEANGPAAAAAVAAATNTAPPATGGFNPSAFPGAAVAGGQPPVFNAPGAQQSPFNTAPPAPVAPPAPAAPPADRPGRTSEAAYRSMQGQFSTIPVQDQFRATLQQFMTYPSAGTVRQALLETAAMHGVQTPFSDPADNNLPGPAYINATPLARWAIYEAVHRACEDVKLATAPTDV